jgi:hypothetical protein
VRLFALLIEFRLVNEQANFEALQQFIQNRATQYPLANHIFDWCTGFSRNDYRKNSHA